MAASLIAPSTQRSDDDTADLELAHDHPICHQRRALQPGERRICQVCSTAATTDTGFFCCLGACDFYMCHDCAASGKTSVLTSKYGLPLRRTQHAELWHCDVCRRDFQPAPKCLPVATARAVHTSGLAACAALPTAAAATALPATVEGGLPVAAPTAVAVAAATAPAVASYHCAETEYDVCEDCTLNPQLQQRKGGRPGRVRLQVAQGRSQVSCQTAVMWCVASSRLLPALLRAGDGGDGGDGDHGGGGRAGDDGEAAAAAAAWWWAAWLLLVVSTLPALIGWTLWRITAFDPSKDEPKLAGDPARRGDWFCERCQAWRRGGTYHCGTCGECTDGFDHHCGVLGRDIGTRNQLAFLWLLSLAAVGSAVTFATLAADAQRLLRRSHGELELGWLVFDALLGVYAGAQALGFGAFALAQWGCAAAGLQQYRHGVADVCSGCDCGGGDNADAAAKDEEEALRREEEEGGGDDETGRGGSDVRPRLAGSRVARCSWRLMRLLREDRVLGVGRLLSSSSVTST
tara:strand:- start:78 stop:1631 length:1554 start_codon:yes stop_codon:yes gene_type:complete